MLRLIAISLIFSSQFSSASDLCDLKFFSPVYSYDRSPGVYVVTRNNNHATEGLSFQAALRGLDTLTHARLCSVKTKYACDVKFYGAVYSGQTGVHVAMKDNSQFSDRFSSVAQAAQIVIELRKRGFCK